MSTVSTFPAALAALGADNPGRPFVTAYDEIDGERTELSVTTYANWVAKTAGVLVDECGLEPGDTVRLELPAHWLSTVFLGAAWAAGIAVTTDATVPAQLRVTGPEPTAGQAPGSGGGTPVLACSLLPFAVRMPEPPGPGVDDFGVLWPGQPDVFVPFEPPAAGTTAWRASTGERTQRDLLAVAADVAAGWAGDRLATDVAPSTEAGTTTLLAAAVRPGSLVLMTRPRDEQWPARLEGERATDVLRSDSA